MARWAVQMVRNLNSSCDVQQFWNESSGPYRPRKILDMGRGWAILVHHQRIHTLIYFQRGAAIACKDGFSLPKSSQKCSDPFFSQVNTMRAVQSISDCLITPIFTSHRIQFCQTNGPLALLYTGHSVPVELRLMQIPFDVLRRLSMNLSQYVSRFGSILKSCFQSWASCFISLCSTFQLRLIYVCIHST